MTGGNGTDRPGTQVEAPALRGLQRSDYDGHRQRVLWPVQGCTWWTHAKPGWGKSAARASGPTMVAKPLLTAEGCEAL